MRKYLIFILLVFLLTGCAKTAKQDAIVNSEQVGNSQNEKDKTEDSNNNLENDPSKETEDLVYSFSYNNIKISLNEEASSIIQSLGESMEKFEAPSCAFQGMDMFYVYPGFELSTYPLDDKHYISTIDFIDDTVYTENGLYIGSSLDEVLAKYGNDFKQSGSIYTYSLGDSSISFAINNDVVENITYTALVGDQK